MVIRLNETQSLVGAPSAVMVNRAIQVNDASALGAIGQFGITYFSAYQTLSLHRVVILRGGQRILWEDDFSWDTPVPIELRRLTIPHPRSRPVGRRLLPELRHGPFARQPAGSAGR